MRNILRLSHKRNLVQKTFRINLLVLSVKLTNKLNPN